MMNWLRKLVGLGAAVKNLTSLNDEECKEEIQAFVEKTNLTLFQGNVQNLYSTQRIKQTSVCPRCEAKTEKKVAAFVCATNTLPQIIISAENYFCTNCSSALIDDKLLQKNCEKGKVYRGIIGFYIRENIQTYQSLNEHIIRYHYDQNSNPSGIKITNEKIVEYDPKIHGSKGTKSQHKIPSSPVTLMDRVERRDKKESLNDSKFANRKNSKAKSKSDDTQTPEERKKAARSERARLAMERVAKRKQSKKTKSKEDFADSVKETKQDFKEKVERKSNFNPKKNQKPVVENPNEKQQEKQVEGKKEDTKKLNPTQKQAPPARASQRKKQTSAPKKEEENIANQQTDNKQNVGEVKQKEKTQIVQKTEDKPTDATSTNNGNEDGNNLPKKNRQNKQKRSTRKTRSNKRPARKTVEAEQKTPKSEVENEPKESKTEQKGEQKNQQNKKQQPRRQNASKQKETAQEVNQHVENKAQNKASEKQTNTTDKGQNQPKNENVIEKLHQNLQESSKASVAPKEEKQQEQQKQQKESSRLARLKQQEDTGERVSRRRPRTNVRPPIDLDLKTPNPRRRYNNTKNK